jgi:hypothetical protein
LPFKKVLATKCDTLQLFKRALRRQLGVKGLLIGDFDKIFGNKFDDKFLEYAMRSLGTINGHKLRDFF